MRIALSLALALFVVTGSSLRAEDAPAASQPSSAPAPALIQATDADALKAAENTEVTVEGVIESAEWSGTGKVMNIRFKESEMRGAAFSRIKDELDKAFAGDVAKSLSGAKVRLKGKLAEFKGHPQIVINRSTQITILEAAPAATSKPAE